LPEVGRAGLALVLPAAGMPLAQPPPGVRGQEGRLPGAVAAGLTPLLPVFVTQVPAAGPGSPAVMYDAFPRVNRVIAGDLDDIWPVKRVE